MAIPKNLPLTGYPNACTDASWKAAKTDGKRDKWNTELGAALRAAQAAYNQINLETVDLGLYRQQHGKKQNLKELAQLRAAAVTHNTNVVKPAIKALEKAKTKAAAAAINPVLSTQTRTRANAIKNLLGQRAAQLKLITYKDYDDTYNSLKTILDSWFEKFDDELSKVLRNATEFVKAVRAAPTPANFNQGIQKAARDITQQLANLPMLLSSGYVVRQLPAPHLVDLLEDWAEGRTLDNSATPNEVRREVKAFDKALMAVKQWVM